MTGVILAEKRAGCKSDRAGWRRVKLCDIVSDTDESHRCALMHQPAVVRGRHR